MSNARMHQKVLRHTPESLIQQIWGGESGIYMFNKFPGSAGMLVLGPTLRNTILCYSKSILSTVIQAYAPTTIAKEAEIEQVYEDLQDLSELTPKKDVLFIIGDWNAK